MTKESIISEHFKRRSEILSLIQNTLKMPEHCGINSLADMQKYVDKLIEKEEKKLQELENMIEEFGQ